MPLVIKKVLQCLYIRWLARLLCQFVRGLLLCTSVGFAFSELPRTVLAKWRSLGVCTFSWESPFAFFFTGSSIATSSSSSSSSSFSIVSNFLSLLYITYLLLLVFFFYTLIFAHCNCLAITLNISTQRHIRCVTTQNPSHYVIAPP